MFSSENSRATDEFAKSADKQTEVAIHLVVGRRHSVYPTNNHLGYPRGGRVAFVLEEDMGVNLLGGLWRRQESSDSDLHENQICRASQIPAEEKAPPPRPRFIARQAIFDRSQRVYGYELLCRSGWENRFVGDSDVATRLMISDGVLYGFQELTRGARTFINCTRESLVDGLVTLLPNTTVLEVLETVIPDEEVLAACVSLKKLGYRIALDDFRMHDAMDALVRLADYIKVDFRISDQEERRDILAYLSDTQAVLVAEKVETEEEFQIAMEEGFQLFQGYFFCHPTVFTKKRAPANGTNYLRLLSALSKETIDVVEITSLVRSEVTICYQLLRLVNSAAFGIHHQVRSIQDALVLVGEDQFRKLVINAVATESCKKHPDELLIQVLHRSRFLELMAPYTGEPATEQYLFGLLSLMNVMLDMPVEDMIDALPLRIQVKAALAGASNEVATALQLFGHYEDGDWSLCMEQVQALRITEDKLTSFYEQSLRWAEETANMELPKSLLVTT